MGVMVPLVSYRRSTINYGWSGSTIGPFMASGYWGGTTNGGTMTAGDIAVNSGVAKESAPTGGANNGQYFSGRCYQDPVGTNLHFAEATSATMTVAVGFPRGFGVGVGGSNNTFTNGVFAIGCGSASSDGTSIITKVGSTLTIQAQVGIGWNTGDKIRLTITNDGTHNIYTVYKNITTQVLQWTDSSSVINPGVWTTVAFGGAYSGSWFGSYGSTGFACGDSATGSIANSYTFVASTHGPFTDWGYGYNVDSSARADNNNSPAINGAYYSGGVYTVPQGSNTHLADVTMANINNGTGTGSGAAVGGSDSSFTNGVFGIGYSANGGGSTDIFSKVGSTYTLVASGGTGAWASNDVMRVEVKYNGTNYYYSVYRNSIDTGVSWVDTGNTITPGLYAGFALKHGYSAGQYSAQGIKGTWHAQDI